MSYEKKKKTNIEIAQKGLVLCNIGAGKGKTTAAIGSAVRASGAGLNVFILQFIKAHKPKEGEQLKPGEWPVSSEIEFFNNVKPPRGMGRIDCEQVGAGFVGILGDRKQKDQHMREALRGLELARKVLMEQEYDFIILDEILSAVDLGLLTEQDIIDLINAKPPDTHIMMTGHEKYPKIFKLCDTVTEMKMVKHAYYEGVLAQFGVDF
jgi:cob(I)alamin adenosyltransferase